MKMVSVYFDGKIGMFPFVEYIPAQRASRNRPRGAIVTTPFSVTKNKYREFMVTKVIAAINDNWPDRNHNIIIQQDGAPVHIGENDAEFVAAGTRGLWKHQARIATTEVARCQRA